MICIKIMELFRNKTRLFNGFTLIELLMIISIITLISSIFFSHVGSASAKSRDSIRLSDMRQINTAATMYYDDNGVAPDSIEILVSTGYLSAVPVDPKTKESYVYNTGFVNGKKVFTASATYEKIYTTNSEGEEIPQQVGVIVGDIDMSNICSLIKEFVDLTDEPIDMNYPTCDLSNTSNDQIIGVTNGHRRGDRNNTTVIDNVSSCLVSDISKTCPSPVTAFNCYCENTIKNVSGLNYEQCIEYNLYWDGNICFDEISCESALRVWNNGVCNPVEVSYSNCSIEEINEQCIDFPPYPIPIPPNLINCYCNGTLNNIDPEVLLQNECKAEYGLYWDTSFTGLEKCFNQTTCEAVDRVWIDGVCHIPLPGELSDCSYSKISLACFSSSIEDLYIPCYCDGELKKGYIPPSSIWEPYECQTLGGEFNYPNSCIFSNVTSNDCTSVGGTVVFEGNYQCSIYTSNNIDGNIR